MVEYYGQSPKKVGDAKMRIKVLTLAAISSLSLMASAAPAMAGGCFNGAPNCNIGVQVIPAAPAQFGPMTVRTAHPMGHLRQIDFQRAPNVSITRVHGMAPTASLADAPSGFTGGCFPTSTNYCRASAGTPVGVSLATAPAPVVAAPYVAPAAPVVSQPTTMVGKGYDPSKFAPRQYGDPTFVPGIAHVPTSFVDRSPENAQAALNSGRTITQPIANGGMTPAFGQTVPLRSAPVMSAPIMSAPVMAAPVMAAPMMGARATAPVPTGNGIYASNVGADGTYWEKASGPTMMGSTVATEVICKRQLPQQVVNPVVNVPYAVPTPVPTAGPACGPGAYAANAGAAAIYEQAPRGRWTY